MRIPNLFLPEYKHSLQNPGVAISASSTIMDAISDIAGRFVRTWSEIPPNDMRWTSLLVTIPSRVTLPALFAAAGLSLAGGDDTRQTGLTAGTVPRKESGLRLLLSPGHGGTAQDQAGVRSFQS